MGNVKFVRQAQRQRGQFIDVFLATLLENHADDDVNFLGDAGAADDGDFATPTARPLFEVPNPFRSVDSKGSREEADAPRGSIFPSTITTLQTGFLIEIPRQTMRDMTPRGASILCQRRGG